MTQKPATEEQAKELFVRQLNGLRRRGPVPASEAKLAAIFARNEVACQEQESRLAADDDAQRGPPRPAP